MPAKTKRKARRRESVLPRDSRKELVVITGMSGSGKASVLKAFEDMGYYCVDNLPATLLLEVVDFLADAGHERAAVSVDARSAALPALPENIARLRSRGVDCRVLYLEASTPTLLRRFSETRRRHPLAGSGKTLAEAIERERQLLAGIAPLGQRIDTSELQPRVLQNWIRDQLGIGAGALTLLSGALMVLAGYVGNTGSWASAGFITIPGGVVILAAFALARRADSAAGQTVAPSRSRRAGSAAASVLMASSPSMRPERRALKALDSMGTTCQSRMPRLFGAGAAWPAPGRVGCGRGPPARPPSTDPSCPPSWSTCFWKCSSRRETLTADLARYSARVSSRRFSASFSETREL